MRSDSSHLQQLFLDGEWTRAMSGATYDVANPYDETTVTTAAAAGVADASRAIDVAHAAFPGWSDAPLRTRRQVLDRAAHTMEQRGPELAEIMADETGSVLPWATFNVALAADMLRAAARHAADVPAVEIPSDIPGKRMSAIRQPAGVVVGIAPWNAPLILGTRSIAAPLALGNTVVLKASEECPRTHGAIVECLHLAGAPSGVVNLLTNAPADAPGVIEELIAHPATRRINFTGSSHIGRIIAEQAGRHLKRVVLELGGKAPLLVLADADLDLAASAANFGAFMHAGQICMSTERVIVDREVSAELATKLAARAAQLTFGDPRDPATQLGPLINRAAVSRVAELLDDAIANGARRLTGADPVGRVFPPTVLSGVTPAMRLYREESFGPVVALIEVSGADEAVQVANDSEYGLSAAVFSQDLEQARDVARRIESGMCHINDATVHDEAQAPFGGVKASGWGRFGGQWAAEEFTELRWITEQDRPRHYPL